MASFSATIWEMASKTVFFQENDHSRRNMPVFSARIENGAMVVSARIANGGMGLFLQG